jgi:hypothetical protein
MRKILTSLIALILCGTAQINANIIVNEMMPCNVSTLLDNKYNFSGWVEIYNSGTSAVNLKGYTFKNSYVTVSSGKSKSNLGQ